MEKTLLKSPVATINPPGIEIIDDKTYTSVGSVSFPKRKTEGILAPYVEAYYNADKNILTARAVVYVDVNVSQNETFTCSIFQNCYVDMNGKSQLQFFIAYDMPEKISKDFTIYEIDFHAKQDIFPGNLSDVETIQTFLWDIDPISSRGTETIVRPT
ncbi:MULTISPECIES: hypothetical protein [unclassified Flavobacterium]|jgi:hypothetical protein|uniref:hypothetical protein n=1 Tax=unclassified Flavobacterium TaxID=196869 RepID=UPI00064A771F|nr:hypothetical protein [Flavobacterium sp. ABG]KLT70982.1 hypothetical protein AB674_04110 [Flavobacterium sp. ABG]